MRGYQLYLIEEEFAVHYFGREHMFFQLFQDYEAASGEMKTLLGKQIQFITKPIPELKLHQTINKELKRKKDFISEENAYHINVGKRSMARLMLFDRFISLKAAGSYDAETCFFEVLRKNESSFMAIDLEHNKYGWLRPIKERKFV